MPCQARYDSKEVRYDRIKNHSNQSNHTKIIVQTEEINNSKENNQLKIYERNRKYKQ